MRKGLLQIWCLAAGVWLSGPAAQAEYLADLMLQAGATDGCAFEVSAPAPRTQPLDGAVKVLPPEVGLYAGLYQIPTKPRDVDAYEAAFEWMPPIVFTFHDWFADTNYSTTPDRTMLDPMEGSGSVPPLDLARYLYERGSVLSLAWAVYCCDYYAAEFWTGAAPPHDHINRILRGEEDGFIRESARQIKAAGVPIMLSIVPEFNRQGFFLFGEDGRSWMTSVPHLCNGYGDPTWPDGPERIRDAMMHVTDLFREEGVTNVTWFMYAANLYMHDAPDLDSESMWLHPKYYYPGDAYIDWVGQSLYVSDPNWRVDYEDIGRFAEALRPGYAAWQSVTDRPLFLPEFGVVARQRDDRRALWTALLEADFPSTPNVKAITIADSQLFAEYFDIPRPSQSRQDRDHLKPYLTGDPMYANALRLGPPLE